MHDNRCPNCENDISELITSVVLKQHKGGGEERHTVACPHCGTELTLAVTVQTTVSRTSA